MDLSEQIVAAQDYSRATAARILRNHPNEIEDVLQNAAVKAILNVDRFHGTCQFRVWFTRIVINEALLILRKAPKATIFDVDERFEDGELRWEPTSPSPSPHSLASAREISNLIVRDFLTLRPSVRIGAAGLFLEHPAGNGTNKARRWRARQILTQKLAEKGITRTELIKQ